jgi:hypothetical protein
MLLGRGRREENVRNRVLRTCEINPIWSRRRSCFLLLLAAVRLDLIVAD